MKISNVKGTVDYLPQEVEIRDYMQSVILETYREAGFERITTPIIENGENLDKSDGGENLNLIFKVLKRGRKLEEALEKGDVKELSDMGLRYDLTLPLSRYYANNRNELMNPFKCIQMDRVYRAEQPQKGRLREFMQCDIDIIGNPSMDAEVELILTTAKALVRVGMKDFKVKINDRRILKAMAAYSGFAEEDFDNIFIILDKMDKIGLEGVEAELVESGYNKDSVEKYLGLFKGMNESEDTLAFIEEKMTGFIEEDVKASFREIIESVKATKGDHFELVFDPTLVRGMSYYTGTIFEIAMPEFGGSCGGGGRYDKMVGRFTGKDVPACGFSIGFERIILILMENGFKVPNQSRKVAYLIEKGVAGEALCNVISEAQKARQDGTQVLVARMNKNKKFQKEQLTAEGYEEFREFYKEGLKN